MTACGYWHRIKNFVQRLQADRHLLRVLVSSAAEIGVLASARIWRQILGGINFTMSIFIAGLAFTEQSLLEIAKLGIFVGSLLAGGTGFLLLFKSGRA